MALPKVFVSIGHFFATVAHGLVKAAKAAPAVEAAAASAEPVVEAISQIALGPGAVAIEKLAFHVFGDVCDVISTTDSAAAAKGVNITLDAQVIADIKALIPQFEELAAALGVSKPAAK